MKEDQITENLVAVHAAYVEKIGGQPQISPSVHISQSGSKIIHLYKKGAFDVFATARGDTFAALFYNAFRIIDEIPDAETLAKREFHKNLANVIDEGNALSMPNDVMQPLSNGMKALSENLLTDQRAAQ